MKRREALQRAAAALGYVLTGPAVIGVLNGCRAEQKVNFTPVVFSADQARLVTILSDIILPRTDTPGASDVGVPAFIDGLLNDIYSAEARDAFLAGLTKFNDEAKAETGSTFLDSSEEERLSYFKKQHDAALSGVKGGYSSGFWNAGKNESKPFVVEMKELTLLGFFTSKVGASEVLQYKQVPGPYQGCVPLAQVGKAWAT